MFDFFLALFGGLYYAGKSSYNKSQVQATENRNRKYEITQSVIRCSTHPKTVADAWVMVNEIEDEIVELFGNDWVWLFKRYGREHPQPLLMKNKPIPSFTSQYNQPKRAMYDPKIQNWDVWAIAHNIWLSKQGLISDYHYAIISPEYFGKISLTPEEQYRYPHLAGATNGHNVLLKMFKMMEANMQKHFANSDLKIGLWLDDIDFDHSINHGNWCLKWSYDFEHRGLCPTRKPWNIKCYRLIDGTPRHFLTTTSISEIADYIGVKQQKIQKVLDSDAKRITFNGFLENGETLLFEYD